MLTTKQPPELPFRLVVWRSFCSQWYVRSEIEKHIICDRFAVREIIKMLDRAGSVYSNITIYEKSVAEVLETCFARKTNYQTKTKRKQDLKKKKE